MYELVLVQHAVAEHEEIHFEAVVIDEVERRVLLDCLPGGLRDFGAVPSLRQEIADTTFVRVRLFGQDAPPGRCLDGCRHR
ncbi:MAG: hypothetical protein F4091_12015 [Acidimicrobiales bacterium]|nr:hypothetical protein [Acidimicrobiaceae bacterium]MYA26793.1 hypothetical protein [Acidimicrobiales bacterium]MYD83135.1 hypothetical protein [Acidimicrobiales bacterium]MYG62703.1 hypothetical protein [Acidimicrobiales bacterium]MYJ47870.1 hypothetical protein [Acidimicrobiales bacterium]